LLLVPKQCPFTTIVHHTIPPVRWWIHGDDIN
jgi:hypothetical protein